LDFRLTESWGESKNDSKGEVDAYQAKIWKVFATTLQISTEKRDGRRCSSPAVLIEPEKMAEHFTRFAKKKLNSNLLVRNSKNSAKNTTTRQMTNVLFEDL